MASKKSVFFSGLIGVIIGSVITLVAIVPFGNDYTESIKANLEDKKSQEQFQTLDKSNKSKESNYTSLYKDIAKSAMPSVVGVTTEFVDTSNYNDIYSFMFGYGFSEKPRVVRGVGTGVIVDSDGYILTNSHVVEDGKVDKVNVLLNDGTQKDATVEWTDKNLDLAIIKIDGSNYPVAKLGDSDKIEVGDIAVAIGNPMGLEFERTVSQGIISGLGRTISSPEIGSMNNLIQTDASINQGNSGGPLLNANAEVIGINTIKVGGEGLGFSIPINSAKLFIDILKKNGEIKEKPVLGITGTSISQMLGEVKDKIKSETGVFVLDILEGSPADNAGIKKNDVIVKINEDKINNMSDLQEALYKYGQTDESKITLTVIRDGKTLTLDTVLTKEKSEQKQEKKNTEKDEVTMDDLKNDLLRILP